MRTDKTNASVRIDWHNHLVHNKKLFQGISIDAIPPGGIISLEVVTPNVDKLIHAKISASASAMMVCAIFEGVTLNGDGISFVPSCRDRSSDAVAPGTWTRNDTGASSGTNVYYVGFRNDYIDDAEVILKKNTTYSFIVWDILGSGGAGMIRVDFYQE